MIFNTTIFGKKPSGSVVDTADATANANDIISPATAYVNGEKVTGTIPTKNAENVGASGDTVSIPAGYYPEVVDKKVEHTTQATPSVTLNSSTGKVTATATQTAGYVEAGTKTGELQLPIKSATDMTVSGATVTAPAGYYAADESKSVATATQATPSVTLNSDTGKVTATATQEAGYVSAGTKTGELQLDTKSSSNLTASGATVTAPAGYYPTAASKSVATATQATPSMSRSGATVTATVTQSAGYVSEGTKTNSLTVPSAGTLTGELTSTTGASWGSTVVGGIKRGTGKFGCTLNQSAGYTSGFSNDSGSFTCKLVSGGTVTPTTSTQSIVPAEYSAYGEIKVAGDANLKAANIRDGVSIFGVSGTYTGSTPSYATPSISVSSSGVITASANGKSATKTLSSSDDSDFIASNIKSGVNIFGVTGSLSGGDSIAYILKKGQDAATAGITIASNSITIQLDKKYTSTTSSKFLGMLCIRGYTDSSQSEQMIMDIIPYNTTATSLLSAHIYYAMKATDQQSRTVYSLKVKVSVGVSGNVNVLTITPYTSDNSASYFQRMYAEIYENYTTECIGYWAY